MSWNGGGEPSFQTESWPLMPALAMTMSMHLLGERVMAVWKRATWSDQVRTLHWTNAALSLNDGQIAERSIS